MGFYRLKHSFTAGELTPLMDVRVDFERYKNGCRSLQNMVCATQGPAVRRPGFKFVFDLMTIGLDPANPIVRMIPFVFNELQAYVMVFYMHTDGDPRVVFATTAADGEDGLVVYGNCRNHRLHAHFWPPQTGEPPWSDRRWRVRSSRPWSANRYQVPP